MKFIPYLTINLWTKAFSGTCILLFSLLLLGTTRTAQAQQRIELENFSFEDNGPNHSTTPSGWSHCNKQQTSPPDIHGYDTDYFEVIHNAQEGANFLGLVTREEGTAESISQRLNEPMQKGKVYWFSLYMARNDRYMSQTVKRSDELTNFNDTSRLQIWGGLNRCWKEQLLGSSRLVEHENWIEYEFLLEPVEDWEYITLEVGYNNPLIPKYGHILIDNCSDIIEIKAIEEDSKINKYKEEELANLDPNTIIQLATECVTYHSTAGYEYPISLKMISKAASFHEQQSTNGLRSYIVSHDMSDIATMIRILESLQVEASTEVLKKATLIYQTKKNEEDVSEEDFQYFDGCDELFLEALQQESILDRLEDYIASHKERIANDLNACR